MHVDLLVGLTAIFAVGVAAQWVAWRVGLPSILLLLAAGILVGPGAGWVDPDALLGPMLFPVVSLAVALVLFEGGLSLRLGELHKVGAAVRNLCTVGVVLAWVFSAAAAHWVAGLSVGLSLLLGAVLTVTGPTVIVPLLRDIRPRADLSSVIKWEGIVNDPTGAILAVLVFEVLREGELHHAGSLVVKGAFATIGLGVVIGAAAAVLLTEALARRWIPDHLHNPVALGLVLAAFTGSNLVLEESGLVTVTLMGVVLANQKRASVRHLVEFYETLRVLLISTLFILLAARLKFADLAGLGWRDAAFVVSLILVARPLTILLSTLRTELSWRDRAFVAWMAPRGVVAAAVTSIFSIRLVEAGHAEAARLVPLIFLVILATVGVYGLTAGLLARRMGLAESNPQGVLLIGAHPLARRLAQALREAGLKAVLADSNYRQVAAARLAGLEAWYGNVLSERALHEIPMDGVGRLLALTPNDEVNSLASMHFLEHFGRGEVYQLASDADREARPGQETGRHLTGRRLFAADVTYGSLYHELNQGADVKVTNLTPEFTFDQVLAEHGEGTVPLFLVSDEGKMQVLTADEKPRFQDRGYLVHLSPVEGRPGVGIHESKPSLPS